jgi:hypothetical protein
MSGHTDLEYLLRAADPVLDDQHYVFVSLSGEYGDYADWNPIATFVEAEGLTLVIPRSTADEHGVAYDDVLQRITLRVHSSLSAVGLDGGLFCRAHSGGHQRQRDSGLLPRPYLCAGGGRCAGDDRTGEAVAGRLRLTLSPRSGGIDESRGTNSSDLKGGRHDTVR